LVLDSEINSFKFISVSGLNQKDSTFTVFS